MMTSYDERQRIEPPVPGDQRTDGRMVNRHVRMCIGIDSDAPLKRTLIFTGIMKEPGNSAPAWSKESCELLGPFGGVFEMLFKFVPLLNRTTSETMGI